MFQALQQVANSEEHKDWAKKHRASWATEQKHSHLKACFLCVFDEVPHQQYIHQAPLIHLALKQHPRCRAPQRNQQSERRRQSDGGEKELRGVYHPLPHQREDVVALRITPVVAGTARAAALEELARREHGGDDGAEEKGRKDTDGGEE